VSLQETPSAPDRKKISSNGHTYFRKSDPAMMLPTVSEEVAKVTSTSETQIPTNREEIQEEEEDDGDTWL